jgi:hypothetical protein
MSNVHLYHEPDGTDPADYCLTWPYSVTFSTSFHNFSYYEPIGVRGYDDVDFPAYYFRGLGLSTIITSTDMRYPFFWTHIEDKNTRYQAYNILRYGTNAGDNIYRFVRNGVDYIDKIKTALTLASNEDIVGVIQLPMTDRLNT